MSIAANQKIKHKAIRQRLSSERGFMRVAPGGEELKRVDRQFNIIRGYKVATMGEAKGHGFDLDETSIQQIHDLGVAAGDRGVKSRFTHPSASGDGLGNYLGRSKDFRRVGDSVIADLHISPRAFDTPNGNLGKYVMDMAESDPDQFGASAVIQHTNEDRLNVDGTRKFGKNGKPLNPVARITKLEASDIVDEPAANEGFFSSMDDSLPDAPARQAYAMLDRYFGESSPEVIQNRIGIFLSSYLSTKGHTMPENAPPATPIPEVKPTVETISKADVSAAAETAAMNAVVAERKRSADILSLCKMANKSDLSEGFIAEGKTVAEVQMALLKTVCEERKLSAGGLPKEEVPPPAADENTPFKVEYAAMKSTFMARGITEADYVANRRIDEGLDQLTPKLA